MHERSIFMEALDLDDPRERRAYLLDACGDDGRLRERVEALLRSHQATGAFVLDRPPVADVPVPPDPGPPPEELGTAIGPYTLRECIGEGGMGSVYVAEQTRPVRRRVALKLIKPGMDTRQVLARFEAERQALALMDHPNIARVHDAGATEGGRPYFVMELVNGIPITDYCDRARLTIPERLELFVLVCRAVQHAHQKGVIHRDLKPSNILVTVIDGAAVPKVIDFGIAKSTGPALAEATLYTGLHQLIGTPLYMSPEQAALSGVDVDTRSDVYALGVLLYELLTGTTPIDRATLLKAAHDEVRRIVREQDPPTPSTRLGILGATLPTISANRHCDARRLGQAVRGELDWIVMKALEKDRARRYETASDFAADVMRHLTDRPVEACPPSAWYRLGKLARRHRAAMTTAGLVGLALVAGTLMSSWQAIRATRAGTLAVRREAEARGAVAQSQAVLKFLVDDMLGAIVTEEGLLRRDVTLAEVVASAEKRVEVAFPDQPLVEAGVRHELSIVYQAMGRPDVALRHASRAHDLRLRLMGPEHLDTLAASDRLARVLRDLGKLDEARGLHEGTLETRRRVLGPEHPDTLASMNQLAVTLDKQDHIAAAHPLFERTLEIRRRTLGPTHPDTIGSMNNLAAVLYRQGRSDEARALFEQVLESIRSIRGPEHPLALHAMINLAALLRREGKIDEARSLYEQTIAIRRRVLGPEHPLTLRAMANLALLRDRPGNPGEGLALTERVLEALRRTLGPDHPLTLDVMGDMALMLSVRGDQDGARGLQERLLEAQRRLMGPEDPVTIRVMRSLVESLVASPNAPAADRARALEMARRTADLRPGDDWARRLQGYAQYRVGDWKGCIETLHQANAKGEDYILAMAYWRSGEEDRARACLAAADVGSAGYEAHWEAARMRGADMHQPPVMLRRLRDEAAALLGVEARPTEPQADPATGSHDPPN